ncbi:MAG: isoprenyl transferase [Elusimicrobiota bacterium]|nr:isoprenyl transferase [Elusimicrobiota bacterium]
MLEKIDLSSPIPSHIAIIMDGNGRWAKSRLLPRSAGHKAGVKTVKDIVRAAKGFNIKVLTLYAFSTENWKRPESEVSFLFSLLLFFIKRDFNELLEEGVKLRILGDITEFPKELQNEINKSVKESAANKDIELNIALNYGARQEIIYAFKELVQKGITNPTQEDISSLLYTSGQPDPDLIIRTSGEFRLSNFLLWQAAYSEIYITDKFWPDFMKDDLEAAICEFQKRERRFGGL